MKTADMIRHIQACFALASVPAREAVFASLSDTIAETLETTPQELVQSELADEVFDFCQIHGVPFKEE